MNLQNHIKHLENHIKDLEWKLKYSKNKDKDKEVILKLRDSLNFFNSMFTQIYYLDSLDALICSLLLNLVTEKGKPIEYNMDLKMLSKKVGNVLVVGSQQKREELKNFLKIGWEAHCLERLKEHGDKEKWWEENNKMTDEYVEKTVREVLDNIKTDLQWTKIDGKSF